MNDKVEARKHMLDNYPQLRAMYDENDDKLTNIKAVLWSFTEAPKELKYIKL